MIWWCLPVRAGAMVGTGERGHHVLWFLLATRQGPAGSRCDQGLHYSGSFYYQDSFRERKFLIFSGSLSLWKVGFYSVYRALASPLSPSCSSKAVKIPSRQCSEQPVPFFLGMSFLTLLTQEWSSGPKTLSFSWEHFCSFWGLKIAKWFSSQITYLIFAFSFDWNLVEEEHRTPDRKK